MLKIPRTIKQKPLGKPGEPGKLRLSDFAKRDKRRTNRLKAIKKGGPK